MKKICSIHPQPGLFLDLSQNRFPTRMYLWDKNRLNTTSAFLYLNPHTNAAYYGFAISGCTLFRFAETSIGLKSGAYFAVHGFSLNAGEGFRGQGIVVEIQNNACLEMVGGPIEGKGRIPYTNGCTDTVLISPPKKGDACLNLLHIPPGVKRAAEHTHPSLRVGYIVRGGCICHTENGDLLLKSGMCFYILENTKHAFETTESEMLAVAWHPDSDFGPTRDDRPMLNRTIIGGASANTIEEIRTK